MINPVLSGLRILELGHYVAAPFCARLLGDLGAEIIKIEPLAGDPARDWGAKQGGRSLWWSMHARNKYSVTIDLKSSQGRQIILGLVAKCDVVLENFRPDYLEKLGLGPDELRRARPDIIIARISGYGQSGPGRDRPAFGVIGEAVGGMRYLTNHPPEVADLPPVRVGFSIGDSVAGLYAAFGIMSALWQRDRVGGDSASRTLDVALTEAILSLTEGMLPEYGALGKIRQPMGGAIATAAPTNAYPTRDNEWVLIAANSEPLFERLARLMGRDDLVGAPAYSSNAVRVENAAALDQTIAAWTKQYAADQLLDLLSDAEVPSSKVYTAADCAADPQFRARSMVMEVPDAYFGAVLQAGIVPHVPEGPGTVRWAGPDVGEHTAKVLTELLNMTSEQIEQMRIEGVI